MPSDEWFEEMKTCLIVDNDAEWQSRVSDFLSGHGIRTTQVANDQEAFDRCSEEMPELVLLSSQRPGAFIRSLRRRAGGCEPIIIVCEDSGNPGAVIEAIWHGASDYLVKPCSRELLDAKLHQTGLL
jgi:two-component system chemotaxis response regulator CheY